MRGLNHGNGKVRDYPRISLRHRHKGFLSKNVFAQMKSYYYNGYSVVFGVRGGPKGIPKDAPKGMPSLGFVTAIHQARLLDYHLDYLATHEVKSDKARDIYNDSNYMVDECNTLIERLKEVKGLSPDPSIAAYAPIGRSSFNLKSPQGTLSLQSYNSSNATDFRDGIVNNVTPTDYGYEKEDEFIIEFSKTSMYRDLFLSENLDIVNVATPGMIENFCRFGVGIFPRPDFAVIDRRDGNVVGFIEHKARTGGATDYNNIFDADVMQTAMYSLLPVNGGVAPEGGLSCWIVQNYSSSKYVLTKLDSKAIEETLDSITSQYHRIANDIVKQNVSSPEGIAYAYLTNTDEHDYWRKTLLCHITNKIKDASSYTYKSMNVTPADLDRDRKDEELRRKKEAEFAATGSLNKSPSKDVWTVGEGGWLLKNKVPTVNANLPAIARGLVVEPDMINYVNPKTREVKVEDTSAMSDGVPDGWIQYYPYIPSVIPKNQYKGFSNSEYGTPGFDEHKAKSNVVDRNSLNDYTIEGDAPDVDRNPCPIPPTTPLALKSYRFGDYADGSNPIPAPQSEDYTLNEWNYERDVLWLPYYRTYKDSKSTVGFSEWKALYIKSGQQQPLLVSMEYRHKGSSGMPNGHQTKWLQYWWKLQNDWMSYLEWNPYRQWHPVRGDQYSAPPSPQQQ